MSEPTLANGWEALGLPAPQASDYGYDVDTGLQRTPFETAQPRQRKRHTAWNRTFTLSFLLSQAELQIAEAALKADGYSWFQMKLVSRGGVLVDHLVRLIEPWSVSAFSPEFFTLSLQVESGCNLLSQIGPAKWYNPETGQYDLDTAEGTVGEEPDTWVARVANSVDGYPITWSYDWSGTTDPTVVTNGPLMTVSSASEGGVLTVTPKVSCSSLTREMDDIYLAITDIQLTWWFEVCSRGVLYSSETTSEYEGAFDGRDMSFMGLRAVSSNGDVYTHYGYGDPGVVLDIDSDGYWSGGGGDDSCGGSTFSINISQGATYVQFNGSMDGVVVNQLTLNAIAVPATTIKTFTANTTWDPADDGWNVGDTVEYLIVGGGGGGGQGGGGGGEVLTGQFTLGSGAYNVFVGGGGTADYSNGGGSGDSSSVFGITADGGYGGEGTSGKSGGSSGNSFGGGGGATYSGGGGGGASEGGSSASGTNGGNSQGGNGGHGVVSDITGTSTGYGGGGGGRGAYPGSGNDGGGNGGSSWPPYYSASDPVGNSGGGGGGAASTLYYATNGASGVVILKWISA